MANDLILIILIVVAPVITIWLANKMVHISFLSPIVMCFGIGIVIRNFGLMDINEDLTGHVRDVTILFALPLLLFSSDVKGWLVQSKSTSLAFGCALFANIIGVTLSTIVFSNMIADIWLPAGMMAGIHSGGTPNLFAVGIALGADEEVYTLTNSAQILWGGIHLLFLLSIAQSLYGNILGKFNYSDKEDTEMEAAYHRYDLMRLSDICLSLILSTAIVALGILVSHIIFDEIEATLIIVFVTTIAIMCSFSRSIRSLRGSFEIGDYCLLMFGLAVAMMSDFSQLMEDGGPYILFVLSIFIITIISHLMLCRYFNIDADTFIITSAAAIYGPIFIPQVAQALQNKSIILGGIAVSLIGLASGNYIGIALGYVLKFVLTH